MYGDITWDDAGDGWLCRDDVLTIEEEHLARVFAFLDPGPGASSEAE